jgi:hypothetical protein
MTPDPWTNFKRGVAKETANATHRPSGLYLWAVQDRTGIIGFVMAGDFENAERFKAETFGSGYC